MLPILKKYEFVFRMHERNINFKYIHTQVRRFVITVDPCYMESFTKDTSARVSPTIIEIVSIKYSETYINYHNVP